jgi:hypothetical protein
MYRIPRIPRTFDQQARNTGQRKPEDSDHPEIHKGQYIFFYSDVIFFTFIVILGGRKWRNEPLRRAQERRHIGRRFQEAVS